jgi:hypothetical protein
MPTKVGTQPNLNITVADDYLDPGLRRDDEEEHPRPSTR